MRCRQARRRGAEVSTSVVVMAHDGNRATGKIVNYELETLLATRKVTSGGKHST